MKVLQLVGKTRKSGNTGKLWRAGEVLQDQEIQVVRKGLRGSVKFGDVSGQSGVKGFVNPIPTGYRRNQPIYERHVTTVGRNRVKRNGRESSNFHNFFLKAQNNP